MRFIYRAAVLLATPAAVWAAPAAATNLFANGDFENAGFGGTAGYYNLGASADHSIPADFGWSVPVNNVDLIANGVYGPAQPGNAGGTYALDLVGYGSTGGISQTINTIAGRHYTVAFDFAGNAGVSHPSAGLFVNGTEIGGVTANDTSWQSYNKGFTGTGAPTVITLSEVYGAHNGGVFLDNISLTLGALPPPSPYTPAPPAPLPHPPAPAVCPASLLGNSCFENSGFGGTTTYYNLGAGADHAVPGDFVWTVPTNNVDLIANGVYGPHLATGQSYGLDLVGYGTTGAIAQPLATLAGQRYRLTVDYSSNTSVTSPTAEITLGGDSLGPLTGTSGWQHYTHIFTGTGSTDSFAITELYGLGSGGVFLDNVRVVAFVPEPESWTLLIAGFGLVGAAARRRRTVVA